MQIDVTMTKNKAKNMENNQIAVLRQIDIIVKLQHVQRAERKCDL